ncbi:hypothetical protein QQF64_021970 [Cirrhinus molitorella]|uniref:Uncharacterized protein n=1 Tax=Cirrhinus molitorella TaxID=172907 RepID=A0ABR3LAG5_9TELE
MPHLRQRSYLCSNGPMCSILCHGGTILSKPEFRKNECFYLMLNKPGLRKPATPMRPSPPLESSLKVSPHHADQQSTLPEVLYTCYL